MAQEQKEQITIVKKKPLTLKASTDHGPGEAAPAPRLTPPVVAGAGKPPSYLVGSISAIVAVLCFFALLFMQWTELQYLSAPTSAGQTAAP